jgi:hypothetical protein
MRFLAGLMLGLALAYGAGVSLARAAPESAAGATVEGSGDSSIPFRKESSAEEPGWGSAAAAFALTIGIGIAVLMLLRRYRGAARWLRAIPAGSLRETARLALSPRCVVHLVEVGDAGRFVVVQSGQQVAIARCDAAPPSPDAPPLSGGGAAS